MALFIIFKNNEPYGITEGEKDTKSELGDYRAHPDNKGVSFTAGAFAKYAPILKKTKPKSYSKLVAMFNKYKEQFSDSAVKDATEILQEEKSDVATVIKELGETDWGKDNDAQAKAVQLLKGLAFSDDPLSNKFMKALSKASTGIAEKLLGDEVLEENRKTPIGMLHCDHFLGGDLLEEEFSDMSVVKALADKHEKVFVKTGRFETDRIGYDEAKKFRLPSSVTENSVFVKLTPTDGVFENAKSDDEDSNTAVYNRTFTSTYPLRKKALREVNVFTARSEDKKIVVLAFTKRD